MTASLVTLSLGGQVAATNGVLTSPQTVACQIGSAVFTNVDSAVHTVSAYVVRSGAGGVPGPSNLLISAQTLAPGQAWVASPLSGRNLAAGDVITGFADTAAVVNFVCDGFTL